MVKIGIIGGSGIYDPDKFEIIEKICPETEFGRPSDEILIGKLNGVEVAFLPRHGKNHQHPPHKVPYKANIKAMKDIGVEVLISPCAVGSLRSKYRPGDIAIVDQFIDFTKTREYTFFDDRTVHIAIPEPFCNDIRDVFIEVAHEMGLRYHEHATYVCIEGPRFSTRAESHMFKEYADIIGMTLVPECQLAREMGMCYCSLATITDYDAWKKETVDIQMVLDKMKESLGNIMRMLEEGLPRIYETRECGCDRPAKDAGV